MHKNCKYLLSAIANVYQDLLDFYLEIAARFLRRTFIEQELSRLNGFYLANMLSKFKQESLEYNVNHRIPVNMKNYKTNEKTLRFFTNENINKRWLPEARGNKINSLVYPLK